MTASATGCARGIRRARKAACLVSWSSLPCRSKSAGERRAAGGSLHSWPFPSDGLRHRGRMRAAKGIIFTPFTAVQMTLNN